MSEDTELGFVQINMNTSESTASECCRTCLGIESDLIPLSADDEDSIKLFDKLSTCVSEVEWDRDGIQSLICHHCLNRLRNAYEFHCACIESDQALQKIIIQANSFDKISEHEVLNTPTNFDFVTSDSDAAVPAIALIEHTAVINTDYTHINQYFDEEDIPKTEIQLLNTSLDESYNKPSGANSLSEYTQDQIHQSTENEEIVTVNNDRDIPKIEPVTPAHESKTKELNSGEFNTCLQSELYSCEIDVETPTSEQETTPEKNPKDNKKFKYPPLKDAGVQARVGENIDKTKPWVCATCGKCYRKNSNLKVHMRTHTGEKPFECIYCFKKFYHSSHLKEHTRRHTGEKPFCCGTCGKRFIIKGELTMHIRSHTGEKPFACKLCERRCVSATDLRAHIRTHTGEKPYECETCGKMFSSTYILSSHMKVHTGDRPYVCNICDKSFTQSSHLTVHKRKHTGEKVTCKVCDAQFSHASQLTVHKRIHTGHEPFKCTICDKVCTYSQELKVHMVKHTGEKYTCNYCEKAFTSVTYLIEHMRTHTGEDLSKCEICDKQFTRNLYLVRHMRVHTGEKPYLCVVCNKRFTQSSSLKVHFKMHTGEKAVNCKICDTKFPNNRELAAHRKTHRTKEYVSL